MLSFGRTLRTSLNLAASVYLVVPAMWLVPGVGQAQDLSDTTKAIDLIVKTADAICSKVELKGNSSTAEVEGAAGVEASKLVKQLVDLKVSGAAKYQKTEYQGVLQADLKEALKNSTTCRQQIFQQLSDKLIGSSPSTPNGCQVSGHVFDRDSHAPIVGAFIDVYTFQEITNIKQSRIVKSHIAISGPDGSFSGDCRAIPVSSFPLRIAVRRVSDGGTEFMAARIDFNDVQNQVNLPVRIQR